MRLRWLFLLILSSSPLWAQGNPGGPLGAGVGGAASATKVATPTLSAASGAVAPGTSSVLTDATSGATMFYTADGSTPTYTIQNNTYFPAGTSMVYRSGDYPSGFLIYGAKTIKAIAAKSGLADSNVVTNTYTLTAPTGTAITTCGTTLAASTTYYLNANISCAGTAFISGGNSWALNLNGHTATYGTSQTAVSSGTNGVTANSTAFHVGSGTPFSSCPTGKQITIDDNSQNYVNTTVASCPSSSSVTLAAAAAWTGTTANWHVWPGAPTFGLLCDGNLAGPCTGAKVYNGTITQATAITPGSNAIRMGSPGQYGDNGANVVSDVILNVNSQDVHAIEKNYSSYGDHIQFNDIVDTSTVVYNRDGLVGYPIKISDTYNNPAATALSWVNDNSISNSPQGGVETESSVVTTNNYEDLGSTIQYVGGYCVFNASAGGIARGNYCHGTTRGFENEGTGQAISGNISDTTDAALVHDPGHNPNGCEIDGNYGVRSKDYGAGADMVGNTITFNKITVTSGACPAQAIRFTQTNTGNTSTVDRNVLTLVMNSIPSGTSSIYAAAGNGVNPPASGGGNMAGITYGTLNLLTISGAAASSGYTAYLAYDGVINWNIGTLATPRIYGGAGGSNASSFTFTGTGTASMTCVGTPATITGTYNAVATNCGTFSSVVANMNSRANTTSRINPGFLGMGTAASSLQDTGALTTMQTDKLQVTRIFDPQYRDYNGSGVVNWSYLNADLTRAQTYGFKVLLTVIGDPHDLAPGGCTVGATYPTLGACDCTIPNNVTTYATRMAAMVHHIDTTFPGVVQYIEFMNEPDNLLDFCPVPGGTATQAQAISAWNSMYSPSYTAMKAQAVTDGATILVGGPALAIPGRNIPAWFTNTGNIISTVGVAKFDFLSFHIYLTGTSWSSWPLLYAGMQSTTQGFVYYYKTFETAVRANGFTGPILLTEYNDGAGFSADCCREDPIYSPIYNSLAITDMLNAVGTYGTVNIPTAINYYAAGDHYFCVFGNTTRTDCTQGAPEGAMPDYYAYKLFTSSLFLDMQAGGYMALSVTPGSTTSGLSATAFYTANTGGNQDSMVIINPTATAFPAVVAQFNNPGITATIGNVYTLNSLNPTIATASTALTLSGGSYSTVVAVPAYSTVAVSIQ